MAEKAGKGGSVSHSSTVAGIKEWSLDWVGDPLETTDFGDSGHKTYIIGLDGGSGSFSGYDQNAAPLTMGAEAALKLYVDLVGTKYFSAAAAIITGIHPAVTVEGVNTISYDFIVNGVITYETS